jgi:hypothetical protein
MREVGARKDGSEEGEKGRRKSSYTNIFNLKYKIFIFMSLY